MSDPVTSESTHVPVSVTAAVREFIVDEVGFDAGPGMTGQARRLTRRLGVLLAIGAGATTMLHDQDCDDSWREWIASQFT